MPTITPPTTAGEGTVLKVESDTTPGTFSTIAQVTEIDGPEVLVEAIDNTAMESGLITTRPSYFPEPDKLSLKVWFDPNDTDTHKNFVTDYTQPRTVRNYQLEFNDDNTTHAHATFHAYQTSFKLTGMKVKSNLEADVELKLTDLPVFTPGT